MPRGTEVGGGQLAGAAPRARNDSGPRRHHCRGSQIPRRVREAIRALKARVAAKKAELKLAGNELQRGVDIASRKDVEISRLRKELDTAGR